MPALFNPIMQVLVSLTAVCLLVVGFMSCKQIMLGLNGNVGLVENSDTYDYFETLYTYGDAGAPAYLVFNNVNYSDPNNIVQMNLIAAELATLNDTIIPPVYSWTSMFENYITDGGVWSETCGSKQAALLDFNSQMRQFVQIKIDSDCCQSYGICGEQYSLDIIFDDLDRVSATRFRIQLAVEKTQADFIDQLLLTRRVSDEFGKSLTANDYDANGNFSSPHARVTIEGDKEYGARRSYL